MEIQLVDNGVNTEDFCNLRAKVYRETPKDQAEKSLKHTLFSVAALYEEKVVGMGRLVGDGVMYWYLQDIIVLPDYQGKGIGKAIVERLIQYVSENSLPGTSTTIGLMAAKGKEGFYEKLGFLCRPSNKFGAGMTLLLEIADTEEGTQ